MRFFPPSPTFVNVLKSLLEVGPNIGWLSTTVRKIASEAVRQALKFSMEERRQLRLTEKDC